MKNKYLFIKLSCISVIVIFVAFSFRPDNIKRLYTNRESLEINSISTNGALDYLWRIKSNPETNSIEIADILRAREQMAAMPNYKSNSTDWIFRGPDNIGGRTRALLIDKDNSTIMYAGGVAGGLWKSTTSGQYWEQVEYTGMIADDFNYLSVTSICQTTNGDIYFGTGEGFRATHGSNIVTPMINGSGIWKSTDGGATFSKLASTWTTTEQQSAFILNFKLAADPTNPNVVYAATVQGLKVTTDGGASWQSASIETAGYDVKECTDVKIATDGSVIASIGNVCFLKKSGSSTFLKRSGNDIESGGHLITNYNVNRLEFAYAPTDPNYVYCITSNLSNELNKIYVSRDGGDTWIIIGKGGSEFEPLDKQGNYAMSIAVFAADKDKVIIGGLDLWYGRKTSTGNLFAWGQISDWSGANPTRFVHSDIHTINFDLKNPKTFFIGNDGGIGRCIMDKAGEAYAFATMNKNYGVTQYYSVATNNKGQLIGGTQDNGSLLITGKGNTKKNAIVVGSGDGGHVAASSIVPSIVFCTKSYGGLYRNVDTAFADFGTFYSAYMIDFHSWGSTGYTGKDTTQASFVTPIAYWETDNDPNNGDTLFIVCEKNYPKDTTFYVESRNIKFAPIKITLEESYAVGETIFYHDPYSTLFALGMARTIWITRVAARNEAIYDKNWWNGIKLRTLDESDNANLEKVTQIAISKDGNNIFFATDFGKLFRISNLGQAYNNEEGSFMVSGKTNVPITTVTEIGYFGNRAITGIACDPNNVDNIIVTLGNYGSTIKNYVYLCNHATTADASTTLKHFIDITDNLPYAPAYCALIEQTPGVERVLVGNDLGVFMADHVMSQASSTVTWSNYSQGFNTVPVFQIKQQTYPKANNYGNIYIATHGMGLWENTSYVSINPLEPGNNFAVKNGIEVEVYPNPVTTNLNVKFTLKESGLVKVELLNVNGQIIKTQNVGKRLQGEYNSTIPVQELKAGVYLLRISNGVSNKTVKLQKL